MAAYDANDAVPIAVSMMSVALDSRVSGARLTCLKPILEQMGIFTCACAAGLSDEDIDELCTRVRAAGFGLGHSRALRELCRETHANSEAKTEVVNDDTPVPTSLLSPKLYFRLARRGLHGLEQTLAQCGVLSVSRLDNLDENERTELGDFIAAAGFGPGRSLAELCRSECTARVEPPRPPATPLSGDSPGRREGDSDEPVAKRLKNESQDVSAVDAVRKAVEGANASEEVSVSSQAKLSTVDKHIVDRDKAAQPQVDKTLSKPIWPSKASSSGSISEFCAKVRLTRDAAEKIMVNLKAMPAEVVRYKDKSTGKMVDARVPDVVLAILRLRSTCNGQELSEAQIARLAVEVMQEQGYDPVRAVASLDPAGLLCPSSAMRLVGSGFKGIVFLVEETGDVVKVMMDGSDCIKEYDIFCAFADAGLAARPIGLYGPQVVPAGELYSIHMEAIKTTLHGVLEKSSGRGQRRGMTPPGEAVAQQIVEGLVRAFQRMWDNGLVHGDLHSNNIAVDDAHIRPVIRMIDFGRSARNFAAAQSGSADALRFGHELDVFRLITDLWENFDELQETKTASLRECEKEIRALRSCKVASTISSLAAEGKMQLDDFNKNDDIAFVSQLHDARQAAGLQAYVAEESKAMEQVELSYNVVIAGIVQYAKTKLDLSFEGDAVITNRRMRQTVNKRYKLCYRGYFDSTLYWGDFWDKKDP